MDRAIEEVLDNLDRIAAGLPLKWEEVPDQQKRSVLLVAAHCCLNGPVGVNKNTTFPIVGQARIKDMVNVSNKSWRGFCLVVANALKPRLPRGFSCNTLNKLGELWPIRDWQQQ
jgi:hypothetical protein